MRSLNTGNSLQKKQGDIVSEQVLVMLLLKYVVLFLNTYFEKACLFFTFIAFIPGFPATSISLSSSCKVGFIMNCSLPSQCIVITPIQKLGRLSENQSIIFHMSASG